MQGAQEAMTGGPCGQEPSGARHRQTGQDIPREPLPPPRQGGRRLEWPPWPQQKEPPAPDESPWTKQDKTRQVKMFLWAQHDLKTALLAVTGGQSTGLGIAAASGHESAPIRRA